MDETRCVPPGWRAGTSLMKTGARLRKIKAQCVAPGWRPRKRSMSVLSARHRTCVKGVRSVYVGPMVQLGLQRAASHLLITEQLNSKAWQMKETGSLLINKGVAWCGDRACEIALLTLTYNIMNWLSYISFKKTSSLESTSILDMYLET